MDDTPSGARWEALAASLDYTVKQLKAKHQQLKRTYGIGVEEFYQIMAEQGMMCPVCDKPYSRKARFCVDHEHTDGLNGLLRGILCFTCNTKYVGHLKLEQAKRIHYYLECPPATEIVGDHEVTGVKPRRKCRRRKGGSRRRRI